MRIVFIASDRMEFAGLLARSPGERVRHLSVDWARTARLNGHQALLVANGVGVKRAAAAADAAADFFRPDALVSTGFCGALDPRLDIAAVVVATCVAGLDSRFPASPVVAASRYQAGPIRTAPHVVRMAAEKGKLAEDGAIAVEMEAAGVASSAGRRGIRFYCVRSITDLAGETLSNDYNAALRPDGHFDTISILGNALRHPSVRLPELFRLRKRCARAAYALGDFLADCRF